jgi:hypothetical protein
VRTPDELNHQVAAVAATMLQVLLHLLRTWDEDPTEPVPVLLSLAGWRPASGESFPAWLARRLSHDYPELAVAGYGPHVIRALADQGRLLPILDGLDETAPEVQRAAVEALNSWMDNDIRLILTSRVEEFDAAVEAAGRALRSAVVLQPKPLTPVAVADYLGRCLPSNPAPAWTELLRPLRPGRRGAVAAGIGEQPRQVGDPRLRLAGGHGEARRSATAGAAAGPVVGPGGAADESVRRLGGGASTLGPGPSCPWWYSR